MVGGLATTSAEPAGLWVIEPDVSCPAAAAAAAAAERAPDEDVVIDVKVVTTDCAGTGEGVATPLAGSEIPTTPWTPGIRVSIPRTTQTPTSLSYRCPTPVRVALQNAMSHSTTKIIRHTLFQLKLIEKINNKTKEKIYVSIFVQQTNNPTR